MASSGRILDEETRGLDITEEEMKNDVADWLEVVVDDYRWEDGWFTADDIAELLGISYNLAYIRLRNRVNADECEKAKTSPKYKYRPKSEKMRKKLIALMKARLA